MPAEPRCEGTTPQNGRQFDLTFLEGELNGDVHSQNLVTASPVPLPATALLLVGALGGLGALRRKRRA